MGFYTTNMVKEAVINGEDQDAVPEDGDYTNPEDDEDTTDTATTDDNPEDTDDNPDYDPEDDYTVDNDDTDTDDNTPEDTKTTDDIPTPVDNTEGDDTPTDYTIPDDAEPAADDTTDTTDDTAGGDDTDYTNDNAGDDTTDATTDDDTTGGDDTTSASAINNDLKQKENELFADLSDEQKAIRDVELKGLYAVLYDSVDNIINRINNIHKTEYTLDVFEFISTKLNELKTLIHYNLTVTFPTKSYIENQITYQECLAVLNTVQEMLKTVEKSSNSNENS